nr:ABC transporter ATP-binding protein [Ulvibacterium marinum]
MKSAVQHSALEIENLSIGYPNKKKDILIARSINFSLQPGELCAIIGINGIGKSTLLRTIGKVQPKLSGEILMKGKSLNAYKTLELAAMVSIVLTEPIASKNLSVLELVALGRQPYTNWIGTLTQKDKSKILEALNVLELTELQHKKCYELSDGQLQRTLIARALAQETTLMLLDEPTSHLDLYHKVQILKLLKSIAHKTQTTVLFTSHEIEMAIQLCDKILILGKGENHFGDPCELIEQKAFEKLFPTDTVTFDARSGSFRIEK